MLKRRNNVFETNSSSSHSISILKNGRQYTPEEIAKSCCIWEGTLHFWASDLVFGRSPFKILSTFRAKVCFALASYSYDEDKIAEIEGIIYEMLPGLKTIEYQTPSYFDVEEDGSYHGDIDHQSAGLLQGFLNKNNVTLRDFLLNTKYVVWIDGDEYNIKEDLFDSGVINIDAIEKDSLIKG